MSEQRGGATGDAATTAAVWPAPDGREGGQGRFGGQRNGKTRGEMMRVGRHATPGKKGWAKAGGRKGGRRGKGGHQIRQLVYRGGGRAGHGGTGQRAGELRMRFAQGEGGLRLRLVVRSAEEAMKWPPAQRRGAAGG